MVEHGPNEASQKALDPRWRADFTARAKAYWTTERMAALVGRRRPPITPLEAPLLLRALGLLNGDASMPAERVRKYRQINHMVALLQPAMRSLMDHSGTVRLLDAACGRSYLSTLLAWMFCHRYHHPVEILGVDRSQALIEASANRAERIGLGQVFKTTVAQLSDLDVHSAWKDAFGHTATPHGVVSLHACDTATDDAIFLGIRLEAHMIAVVPCCQAELAAAWEEAAPAHGSAFAPLRAEPHLRRNTAAHVTDTMRLLLMRGCGYDTTAIEFVPMEHTPKNTLIRGTNTGSTDIEAWTQYNQLVDATGGVGLQLAQQLTRVVGPLIDTAMGD